MLLRDIPDIQKTEKEEREAVIHNHSHNSSCDTKDTRAQSNDKGLNANRKFDCKVP